MLYSDGCEYGGLLNKTYPIYLSFNPITENASCVVDMPYLVFPGGDKTKYQQQISHFVPAELPSIWLYHEIYVLITSIGMVLVQHSSLFVHLFTLLELGKIFS